MKYKTLTIKVKKEYQLMTEGALVAAGFDSMMVDDPSVAKEILDQPELYKYDYLRHEIEEDAKRSGGDIVITLYFGDDEEGESELKRACAVIDNIKEGIETGDIMYEASVTPDDSEWLYKWQEFFKTTKVGERIVIKPSWEDYTPKAGELVIEMDPGMAFGSGQHETTSMCIKALEKHVKPGSKVLDVGTGTGVLAVAAALLGADECLGIDIDEGAVTVANTNIQNNKQADRITAMQGDLTEGVDFEADIIVANLMADLVIKLAPAAADQLKAGSIFISSGILDIKEELVADAVKKAGFRILEILHDGEWRAIIAERI